MTWNNFFKQYLFSTIILFFLFIATLIAIYNFLIFIEQRVGSVLNDPLLNILPSVNVSIPLFILTYSGTIIGVFYVLQSPSNTILTALTYIFILWFRMICMYFTPLEPPEEIIPLRDFILENTFYSGEAKLKDLFFSGHTASMFLFFVIIKNKKLKFFYLVISILVALLVLLQHAHYTIDVLVAPVMVFCAFEIAKIVKKLCFKNLE